MSLTEYRCAKCGWWLFSSDAEHGHVEVTCKNRRCEKRQMVYLGGHKDRAKLQVVRA